MLNIPGFTFPVKEYVLEDIVEILRHVKVLLNIDIGSK